ncbi:hypothetical protein UFOVP1169_12 [uncultured Caudovirales phage]|uniref:Phage major capsid protein n=1 Tax=uncultured Caudovirales phage TaxID=2100421 RepID=A0A6J5R2R7_9CAUD|nr:hypothetical protein UFOVP1169_12 [uncultured Caudovirales phage]
MADPGLSEIVTSTLRDRSKVIADNTTNNNAILRRLNKRGNIKYWNGGRTIVQELDYAGNNTYTRYSGADVLDISPQTVLTAAEFQPKQAAVSVNITGLEELQNSGPNAVLDLLEARIRNAERTMENGLTTDMYSSGTASSGKQIGGLGLIVATTNTNTVGGISGNTWQFWRNLSYSASGQGSPATAESSSSIQLHWNDIWAQTTRGNDVVDLILASNLTYNYYMASLQPLQRFTQSSDADAGFTSLKYQGADVVLDGGIGGNITAGYAYFLNTNYIFWRPHKDRNIVPLDDGRFSVNQDAMVKLMVWAGNMTCSSRRQQAVYYP